MTAMTDEKRVSDDELREIIAGTKGVTPGPWYTTGLPWFRSDDGVLAGSPDGNIAYLIADCDDGFNPRDEYTGPFPIGDKDADAAHIARLDPQTVTAICEELLARRSHQGSYRLVPVEPTDGWRPIETAPKDGTCIYLAWNSEDWTMAEGMWRGDEWVTSATFYNPDLPHPRMEFREYRPKNPLWWQPLPAAPSPKEGK